MSSHNQNLDLDFQDYPSTSVPVVTIPQTEDSSVKIDLAEVGNLNSKQALDRKQSVSNINSILNRLNFDGSISLSEENIQQLLRLSNKQKGKQQRDAINSSGNWGLGYLAQYFDVTTEDVCRRIIWSAIPLRKAGLDLEDLELTAPLANNLSSSDTDVFSSTSRDTKADSQAVGSVGVNRRYYSFIERFIQSRPDLYGPFWISVTLIFSIAIFSNLANFFNYRSKIETTKSQSKQMGETNQIDIDNWHYSIDELSWATSTVILQALIIPSIIWFSFWFRGCARYYTLIETICAYGYSLSIFVPLSVLLMIQEIAFRYFVIVLASLMSGLSLMLSFWPVVQSETTKGGSHLILIIVPAFQFLIAFVIHRIMLQTV